VVIKAKNFAHNIKNSYNAADDIDIFFQKGYNMIENKVLQ